MYKIDVEILNKHLTVKRKSYIVLYKFSNWFIPARILNINSWYDGSGTT